MGPGHWGWLILGAVLIGIELAAPGFALLWLGLSAVLTGLLVLFGTVAGWPMSWEWQLLLFAALSMASVALWLAWRRREGRDPDDAASGLNRRARACVGRHGVLEQPIGPGNGRLRLGDTTWSASGPALPAGTAVRVVGADGGRLEVVALEEPRGPEGEVGRTG